jgi:ATP-dependent Clp protease ATP-binding subunit ClpA
MHLMFERFTEPARQVVVFSQEEARTLSHDYIGTEHLLLGLLREEQGVAAHVLSDLGLELEPTRAAVMHLVGSGKRSRAGRSLSLHARRGHSSSHYARRSRSGTTTSERNTCSSAWFEKTKASRSTF